MSETEPSPQTTLGILLGASAWPSSSLQSSPAFANSAKKVRNYFLHPHHFGLPPENWLDLFDTSQNSPNEVDLAISTFLDERLSQMKQAGTPARDLLFYYIGHGVFAPGHDQAYHLTIRCTRDENLRFSAIAMAALADTLKTKARQLRRIVILDCCFAAESLKYMQAAPDQGAVQQTISAFEVASRGHGFPKRGTTLLCSSGHKASSFILQDESGTMFSEAFIRALSLPNKSLSSKTQLSLYDVKVLTAEVLESFIDEKAPRPEIHSPDQSEGDVASVLLFPNPSADEDANLFERGNILFARERYKAALGAFERVIHLDPYNVEALWKKAHILEEKLERSAKTEDCNIKEHERKKYEEAKEIFSQLLKERIVVVNIPIDNLVANSVAAQLLYLQSEDMTKDITLYINSPHTNSPDSSIYAGFVIYDTIQLLQPDVSTVCIHHASGLAAILLASGTKGKRYALPHSSIGLLQIGAGPNKQAADIELTAREILRLRRSLVNIFAYHTRKSPEKIVQDMDEMILLRPESAKRYGIIDGILE